ncbi:carbohydrate kinase family protein [Enterococcus sp. AZ109]|uniref:carbohydrate kinase family protein n=1 Tax=Enterococcus sp. AZ109 TaxID=2774634 RepID=UPI003F287187
MSILCIGQAVYDITFPTEDAIVENQKYQVYDRYECMGAPAANAAYLCGLWGIETSLIARVGNDLFGKEILRTLAAVGVNTNDVRQEPHQKTSLSCIVVNKINGDRTIWNAPLQETEFSPDWPHDPPKVILVDGHERNISLEALQKYPKATSLVDAGSYKPELDTLFQTVDYLVCSEVFAFQYSGISLDINEPQTIEAVFTKLEDLNPNQIVVTLGERGSVFKQDGTIHHVPAFPTKPVDTTGAGDIFHGAFAYGLHQGKDLRDIVLFASATAALSVERMGGQTSIPTLKEVETFL